MKSPPDRLHSCAMPTTFLIPTEDTCRKSRLSADTTVNASVDYASDNDTEMHFVYSV